MLQNNTFFSRLKREAIFFIVAFFLFTTGSWMSLQFLLYDDWSRVFFPTILCVVLVHWFGLRTLIPCFIGSVLLAELWGFDSAIARILISIPNVIFGFLSWFIISKYFDHQCWLANLRQFGSFLFFGIIIPLCLNVILHEFVVYHFIPEHDYSLVEAANMFLSELISLTVFSFPLLYFFTHKISKLKFSALYGYNINRYTLIPISSLRQLLIIIVPISFLLVFNYRLNFVDYWYLFGLLGIVIAVKWGFAYALLINLIVFINTYIIKFSFYKNTISINTTTDVDNMYIVVGFIFITSSLIGRITSDNYDTELKLQKQNRSLKKVNRELDRFAYSVSHELSAPLKSIMGLVHLANVESDPHMLKKYLEHIQGSTQRMDEFIKEVLEFYVNGKKDLEYKVINLRELLKSIMNDYRFHMDFESIIVKYDLEIEKVISDELRLRIIFNNLISNAFQYRNKNAKNSYLWISSWVSNGDLHMTFEDNGQGFNSEIKNKIFRIFYRGNVESTGAGLGLYITNESVNKLRGKITVNSTLGKGSVFKITIPEPSSNGIQQEEIKI